MNLTLRLARLDEIIDLRHAVLRPGFPRDSAIFPGDDAATTRHFAAFLEHRVVGCLTLHHSEWQNQPAYHLRGMAIAADLQRQGVGRLLLNAAEAFVLTTPIRILWCNARKIAIPFYRASGWQIMSEEFEIPSVGPHVRMTRSLPT
jgi:GNAT superfamily N-acetyltransferase